MCRTLSRSGLMATPLRTLLALVALCAWCPSKGKCLRKQRGTRIAYVAPSLRVPSGACQLSHKCRVSVSPQLAVGGPRISTSEIAPAHVRKVQPIVTRLGHHVLLLITQGLEDLAVQHLKESCGISDSAIQILPNAKIPLGEAAVSRVIVTLQRDENLTAQVERLHQCGVVQAVLAYVAAAEGMDLCGGWTKDAASTSRKFGRPGVMPTGVLAQIATLVESSPHWPAAFELLAASGCHSTRSFRASAASSGREREGFDSEDVMRAMGGATPQSLLGKVNLDSYDVEFFGTLIDGHFACGLILGGEWRRISKKNYEYTVIPFCEYRSRAHLHNFSKPWYMPSLRPSTALLLLLLAGVRQGDTILDPFGGSGGIAMEAATRFEGATCVTSDKAELISRAAIKNVLRTRAHLARGSSLDAQDWDARNLKRVADGSVDRYVADLPFNSRCQWNASADLPKVLAEVRRVLRPVTGRCVLLMQGYILLQDVMADLNTAASEASQVELASQEPFTSKQRLLIQEERRVVNIGGFMAYATVLRVE